MKWIICVWTRHIKHVLKWVDWLVDERVNNWVDSWVVIELIAEMIAELIAEHVSILIVVVLKDRNYEERKKMKTSNSLASTL